MTDGIAERIRAFDGLGIVTRFDAPTGTWIFICLHDDTLGKPSGGTRMRQYERPGDGLLDGMRLARGMTRKWAALGLPFGGGKAVLAIQRPLAGAERDGLLERYGSLVESLGGLFGTGEDMGTTPADFEVIARRTRFVHGLHPQTREKIDPGPFTARGVFHGMEAAAADLFPDGVSGRSVLVQGAGNVGSQLAELLHAAGAQVLVSDIDRDAAAATAAAVDGRVVAPDETYDVPCDIYAPCAVGATLDADTIPRLACRLVAGSANNQLATGADAERLHARGIVYAPDYIINAGGAFAFALMHEGETRFDTIFERMQQVGRTVGEILREANVRGESPVVSADRRVERTLQAARREADNN